MNTESNFVEFQNAKRIWAVGSVHSNYESFNSIKNYLLSSFDEGDKLTISSIIDLRFKLMAKFQLQPDEIVFLRGAQEEMFLKLMLLQIAPNPQDIVKWMFSHGVDKTIQSYGFSKEETQSIASQGTLSISKWTSKLNAVVSNNAGHKDYFSNLKPRFFLNQTFF